MYKILTVLILVSLLFPSLAYADNPDTIEVIEQQLRRANNEKRMEYYRGAYDVCMYAAYLAGNPLSESVVNCLDFVERARKSKWFEQDSNGW